MALLFLCLLPLPMAPLGTAECLTPSQPLEAREALALLPSLPSSFSGIIGVQNNRQPWCHHRFCVFYRKTAAAACYSQWTGQNYLASANQPLLQFLAGFVPNGPYLGNFWVKKKYSICFSWVLQSPTGQNGCHLEKD